MKCFMCLRLKRENRVTIARDGVYVVAGYSMCEFHAVRMDHGNEFLRSLENARNALRRWWEQAEEEHGEWNQRTQKFKDKTKAVDPILGHDEPAPEQQGESKP